MNLPKPGIEPGSPALQVNSLPTELSGKPYNGMLFSHEMNEILPFAAAWMLGLENIMLSEISQREKDKHCLISFICEL